MFAVSAPLRLSPRSCRSSSERAPALRCAASGKFLFQTGAWLSAAAARGWGFCAP